MHATIVLSILVVTLCNICLANIGCNFVSGCYTSKYSIANLHFDIKTDIYEEMCHCIVCLHCLILHAIPLK
jgi:hypothetical protein